MADLSIIQAAERGNASLLTQLLRDGADVDQVDEHMVHVSEC